MSDYKSIKDIDSLHSIIEKLYIENNNLIKENKLLLNEKELKNKKNTENQKKYYEKNKEEIIKNNIIFQTI